MKLAQALPRGMRFEAKAASSVELCVAEWVSGSRYRDTTLIVAEPSREAPLLDAKMMRLKSSRRLSSFHLALALRLRSEGRLDLIVTQQHIATAARIALLNKNTPVILQTHNFIEPPIVGRGARLKNLLRQQELQSLAGLTLVSDATKAKFESDWPDVTIPRAVVTNGFDFRDWTPAASRENHILVVGRNQPEKGILEAAEGCAKFLKTRGDWRVTFVLSEIKQNSEYLNQVETALQPVTSQAEILSGIPFAAVKSMTERAAISIVASRWQEPFGRTALEAHAGGAALISSGTGGLQQISGDTALMLEEVSGDAIARALGRLGDDANLRANLAALGAERVRRLFPLSRAASGGSVGATPVSEGLDNFYDTVVHRPKR